MYDLKKSTGPTNVSSLKSDKHMLVISFTVSRRVLQYRYNNGNAGNND